MSQLDLLGQLAQEKSPHNGVYESIMAALAMDAKPTKKANDYRAILDYLSNRKNDTDGRMQIILDMAGDTQRPRRGELCNGGFIVKVGRTKINGSWHTLWAITDKGRSCLN